MRRRVGPALVPVVLACTLVAACGGDDEQPTLIDSAPAPRSKPGPASTERSQPATGDGRGGVRLAELGSFEAPVYVAQPPGERDLFVVEQPGRIVRLSPDGTTSGFLDLTDRVSYEGERGLLSVAFAPDWRTSRRFYVNYTDNGGDTRVVEFTAEGRRADPASAREVLGVDQPFANHNGGQLQFGPDGLLYIGMGDGGSGGDPSRTAQDLGSLLGKLLRIDPRARGDSRYTVPADNPFSGTDDARPEIYAYGLRNPWRFSFDRLSGALSIGDVGQNAIEEVDLVAADEAAGANFGWSAYEGRNRFNADQQAPDQTGPVLVYAHADGGCSVTGGYVVRDRHLPTLYGRYLYGDFCSGVISSFTARPGRRAGDDRPLGIRVPRLSSFGEDARGRIYLVSIEGPVYRLAPTR